MVADGQQNQQAAIRALAAHLPLVFQGVGKIGRVLAIEVLNRDHGHLCVGLRVVELGADRVQPGNGPRREDVGEVADVIGGLGQILDPFGQRPLGHGGNGGNS